ANIGLIAYTKEGYEIIKREVTPDRVKEHFGDLVKGEVERYELPNLNALEFVLHGALDGGATKSLRMDNLGKNVGQALLLMEVEV
ncbi:MAG: hypothetical protein COS88_05080, partial [Chloroflexi bacterium CG07_land_8_20_14_0_80_51_10]